MAPPPRSRALALLCLAFLAVYLLACCASATLADFPSALAGRARALRPPADEEKAAAAAKKAAARAELGRATWTLLHRLAAAFDKAPSAARAAEAARFFGDLSTLYPCPECAAHMREMFAAHPPDARSNAALSLWLCARHNDVNARLGKPAFPCDLGALKERWGECGCFDNATAVAPAAVA